MRKILVKKSGHIEFEHEITSENIPVGRDPANTIVLSDASVSRKHARIERSEGGYRIVDLGSGNGILHNGEQVESLHLYPGCIAEIGIYSLEFQSDEEARPKLILIGGAKQRVYELAKGETLVGRSPEAPISIQDPLISSSHLKVVQKGSAWGLVDLGSQNGTRVNGIRVNESELKQGDQIRIGGFTFLFSETGVVPEPGSVRIIEAAQAPRTAPIPPSVPATEEAPPSPEPDGSPVAAASRVGLLSDLLRKVPRLVLIGAGAFAFCLMLLVLILLRSPEDDAVDVGRQYLSDEEQRQIDALLDQAKDYEQAGSLSSALEQYQKVLVLNPNHQVASEESVRLKELIAQEEEERARQAREERERMGLVAEKAEQADELVTKGEFEEGRKLLEEALAIAPDSEVLSQKMVASYVAEGDVLRRRNTTAARRAYEEALKLDPNDEAAKKGLSRIDANRRASRERQQRIKRFTEQGLAELKREEYQEAYASFSEVLKLDPKNTRAQEFREQARVLLEEKVRPIYEEGVRLYNNEELAAAMAQFNRVLEIQPDHADTRAFVGRAMERIRSTAVDTYKRAYIYEGLGKFREALELYEQTLALLPDPKEEYHRKAAQRIEELKRKRRQ
jgi:pSer/pThr/pTyr-binding forkhead associated (FHA) protein/tetratricopeptide (TPR) repeat protein